jgi:hypothetical protein
VTKPAATRTHIQNREFIANRKPRTDPREGRTAPWVLAVGQAGEGEARPPANPTLTKSGSSPIVASQSGENQAGPELASGGTYFVQFPLAFEGSPERASQRVGITTRKGCDDSRLTLRD